MKKHLLIVLIGLTVAAGYMLLMACKTVDFECEAEAAYKKDYQNYMQADRYEYEAESWQVEAPELIK